MFLISQDKTMHLTRGDIAIIDVTANTVGDEVYTFAMGDILRFKVFERKRPDQVVIEKDVNIAEDTPMVTISLSREETKIGDLISKPVDYWYEVELNPETNPQTIIGYDTYGPKIFRLYPEGED